MKKIYATKPNTSLGPQHRSFRRFVRNLFAGLLKRQSSDYAERFQQDVIRRLQDIQDLIEIEAREMARQTQKGK